MTIRKRNIYDGENGLNPNYISKPKTDFYCVICNKDINPNSKYFFVHFIDGGVYILHSEDELKYIPDGGDVGFHPVGISCAKKIGLQYCHKKVDNY